MFIQHVQVALNQINKTEFKVLLSIVKLSQYRNVFNITQSRIAEDSELLQYQVSKAMSTLKEKSFILKKDGVEYVNPFLFVKGGLTAIKSEKAGALSAVRQLNLFTKSTGKSQIIDPLK